MAGRIEPRKLRRRAILLGLSLIFLPFGLLLPSCRNPLMDLIESPAITIKVDGKTVSGVYELGPVKQGVVKPFVVTLLNSGNTDLKLTGAPLVLPSNSLFTISQQPATLVKVRDSTTFTVSFNATAPEGTEVSSLTIENNSRDSSLAFSLAALVDATPPSVETQFPVGTGIPTNVVISAHFSEEMDPDTVTDTSFTVKKFGAPAPVAATIRYDAATMTATLDPAANLDPTSDYLVEVTIGITDVAGFALVPPGAPWVFTTGIGTDGTPPSVVSTSPAANANGVATSANITVTFNESLDPTAISNSSFKLYGSGLQVAATVNYDSASKTATLNPTLDLALGTLYEARLAAGIKDTAGNATATPYEWSFTTTQGAVPPTVVAKYPGSGAGGISTNTVVTVEFSEPMNPASLTNLTFYVDAPPGNGTVSYNAASRTATFDPTTDLTGGVVHSVFLTAGITDSDGMALTAQSWAFTTSVGTDSTPPTVTVTSPLDAATNVLLAANITATFSESMDPASINTSTFTLYKGATPVTGTVSYSEFSKTATFDPTGLLDLTAVYTATVKGSPTGVKDAAGNLLAADQVWSFTTEAGTSPPTVISVVPANLETGIDIATTVVVEFSKMMDDTTITTSSFKISDITNPLNPVPVSSTVSYNAATRKATLTPDTALQYLKSYKVDCTAGIEDIGGNALTPFSSIFTTVAENKWDSMRWDQGKWGL